MFFRSLLSKKVSSTRKNLSVFRDRSHFVVNKNALSDAIVSVSLIISELVNGNLPQKTK